MSTEAGIHNNSEPKPGKYGTDAHDHTFEGSCFHYAKHLVEDHGYPHAAVTNFENGSDQSSWSALNSLHRSARSLNDGQRVTWAPDTRQRPQQQTESAKLPPGVHGNGESKPATYGSDQHDEEFDGDNAAFATHLIEGHGYPADYVERAQTLARSISGGVRRENSIIEWNALRSLHREARRQPTDWRAREAKLQALIHNNGEPKPDPLGPDEHDLEFNGFPGTLGDHLVHDHGYSREKVDAVGRYAFGDMTVAALRRMHFEARSLPDRPAESQ